jgi:hypothetical protein
MSSVGRGCLVWVMDVTSVGAESISRVGRGGMDRKAKLVGCERVSHYFLLFSSPYISLPCRYIYASIRY